MISMHTMVILYNNSGHYTITMKQNNNQKRNESGSRVFFYPRIIREFDDGHDEKPMIYGGGE